MCVIYIWRKIRPEDVYVWRKTQTKQNEVGKWSSILPWPRRMSFQQPLYRPILPPLEGDGVLSTPAIFFLSLLFLLLTIWCWIQVCFHSSYRRQHSIAVTVTDPICKTEPTPAATSASTINCRLPNEIKNNSHSFFSVFCSGRKGIC